MFSIQHLLSIFVLFIISAIGASSFSHYIEQSIIEIKNNRDAQSSLHSTATFRELLESQKRLTTSIATALSQNTSLQEIVHSMPNEPNIDIVVFNAQGQSITPNPITEHSTMQSQIKKMLSNPKLIETIDTTSSSLSFCSMVPLYDANQSFIGSLMVIRSQDDLIQNLKNTEISSLMLIPKENNKYIKQAITQHRLSDYTIIKLNTHAKEVDLVASKGLNYFISHAPYRFYENHIITPYSIQDKSNEYFLVIQPIDSYDQETIHTLRYSVLIIVFIVLFLALLFIYRFYQNKNQIDTQRKHFKQIINSTSDIIIITNSDTPIDANRAFYKFFDEYESLEEFEKEYETIANLFVEEEGFVQKELGPYSWVEYVFHHKEQEHQVKIIYKDKEYIFAIKIQSLAHSQTNIYNEELYTVVLTDITKMKRYQEELEHISKTDMLTKIGNREAFYQQLNLEIARATRHKTELSLILFDIDNFKKINQLYGDKVGDSVLVTVAHSISELLRTTDVICRYSGDEFMIILPKVQSSGASILATRICNHIEALAIERVETISVTIGLTEFQLNDEANTLVHRVDQALSQAKESHDCYHQL